LIGFFPEQFQELFVMNIVGLFRIKYRKWTLIGLEQLQEQFVANIDCFVPEQFQELFMMNIDWVCSGTISKSVCGEH
jgi:hypothetical protein